jgi:hypothetical protein
MIMSRWILLRMRNVSDKSCTENQNTLFIFNNFFFRKSCRLWDNIEKYGRAREVTDDNTIRRMRFACSHCDVEKSQKICSFRMQCFLKGGYGRWHSAFLTNMILPSSSLKAKAGFNFEAVVNTFQSTRCHAPEYHNQQTWCIFLHFRISFRNLHQLIRTGLFNHHVNVFALPKATPGAGLESEFIQFQHIYVHTPTCLYTHQTQTASSHLTL